MPRARSPARDKAKELYLANPTRTLKSIGEEVGKSETQIRKWKSIDNWDGSKGNVTNQTKGNVTNQETVDTSSKRKGNPNPTKQFPERNQAAKKHGLFSRYMPAETLDIINELEMKSPKDLLWDQIQIQYAAIIRAQKIMHVKDEHDHLKLKIRETAMSNEYQTASAGDRYATFLTAQSRAIAELRTSVNHYNKIADEDDERRLKLESMRLDIELKKDNPEEEEVANDGFMEAIKGIANNGDVWDDDNVET